MNKYLPSNDSPIWSLATTVAVLTAVTISLVANASHFDATELRTIWFGVITGLGGLGIQVGVQKALAGRSAQPPSGEQQGKPAEGGT